MIPHCLTRKEIPQRRHLEKKTLTMPLLSFSWHTFFLSQSRHPSPKSVIFVQVCVNGSVAHFECLSSKEKTSEQKRRVEKHKPAQFTYTNALTEDLGGSNTHTNDNLAQTKKLHFKDKKTRGNWNAFGRRAMPRKKKHPFWVLKVKKGGSTTKRGMISLCLIFYCTSTGTVFCFWNFFSID